MSTLAEREMHRACSELAVSSSFLVLKGGWPSHLRPTLHQPGIQHKLFCLIFSVPAMCPCRDMSSVAKGLLQGLPFRSESG